jgi:hypothetical protein
VTAAIGRAGTITHPYANEGEVGLYSTETLGSEGRAPPFMTSTVDRRMVSFTFWPLYPTEQEAGRILEPIRALRARQNPALAGIRTLIVTTPTELTMLVQAQRRDK